MRIGIEVNGVLRDTIEKFKQVYEKHLIEKNEDDFVNKTFEIDEFGNEEEKSEITNFEYKFLSEVDSLKLMNHFSFQSKEELFNFMFEEFPMYIFGHAPSTEMTTFNLLNEFYLNNRDNHDLVIISDEMGKSKPATLFFLSKFGCLFESVIFYNQITSDKILSSFDLIVTSNPDIIINYSDKLTIIKFETAYNKQVKAEHTICSLKELSETLNKIENAKII
jgi:hypothetical protein